MGLRQIYKDILVAISFTKTLPLFNNILTIEDQVFYFNNNTVINYWEGDYIGEYRHFNQIKLNRLFNQK